jgi:hypothetical protein
MNDRKAEVLFASHFPGNNLARYRQELSMRAQGRCGNLAAALAREYGCPVTGVKKNSQRGYDISPESVDTCDKAERR